MNRVLPAGGQKRPNSLHGPYMAQRNRKSISRVTPCFGAGNMGVCSPARAVVTGSLAAYVHVDETALHELGRSGGRPDLAGDGGRGGGGGPVRAAARLTCG